MRTEIRAAHVRDADRQFHKEILTIGAAAGALAWHATAAERLQRELSARTFAPKCLTLYPSNVCSLRCTYCHVQPDPLPHACKTLSTQEVLAAAEFVASACARENEPLRIVFHGGGEPTLSRHWIQSLLPALGAIADHYGIRLWTYLATNGAVNAETARWIADTFDLVGLSFDGLPAFQDQNRPFPNGQASSPVLLRTGRILRERKAAMHVRSTITPESMTRQAAMAEFIIKHFKPAVIRFEPAYHARNASPVFTADDAAPFTKHFLAARSIAKANRVSLLTSGSRTGQMHGPYCNPLRGVLNLVPGGVMTACFELSRAEEVRNEGVAIARYIARTNVWEIDFDLLKHFFAAAGHLPPSCQFCFNAYHCVRGCPDSCFIRNPQLAMPDPFRCRFHGCLAFAEISSRARFVAGPVGPSRGQVRGAMFYEGGDS